MSSGRDNIFVVLVVLIAVSAASAHPTIVSGASNKMENPRISMSVPSNPAVNVSACNFDSVLADERMTELARAIFQPPSTDNHQSSSKQSRCLPPLPAAFLMGLTGFICVSLVRDRRTWIAVFAGLLWLGQAGFNALPELTSRLSQKIHNCSPVNPELLAAYSHDGVYYPENFNEQIRYTGLLRHLEGIPYRTGNFTKFDKCFSLRSLRSLRWNYASQHAVISSLLLLNTHCSCPVRPTRQLICFTPAFIFNLIPRGPPIP